MSKEYTDTELLDKLQELTNKAEHTGRVIMRKSTTGRGWRLHESAAVGSVYNVRQAIINFIEREGDTK